MFVSTGEANILHADLDSFFASVEQRDDPRLQGRPVAVGGGVVLAASYEAKAFGVKTAMPGRKARELCPQLIEVPSRFEAYSAASKEVFRIFDDMSPVVEGMSIDEAFLDVRGMRQIAGRRWRSPRACASGCGARSGCRSRSGSRGRSSWPRSPLASRSRTGCCSWSPIRRSRSCTRCRSRSSGASGSRPRTSCTRVGSRRWARSRNCRRPCSSGCSGARRAGNCTRWRTIATRGG